MKKINREDCHTEAFRLLMWHVHGITYSKKTYNRRLNLLSNKEYDLYSKQVDSLLHQIDQKFINKVENIDEIMCKRAEIENDEWN